MDKRTSDHDLMLKLHEKVDVLLDIAKDHEPRIRKLEQQGYIVKGALGILIFLSGLIEPLIIWKKR